MRCGLCQPRWTALRGRLPGPGPAVARGRSAPPWSARARQIGAKVIAHARYTVFQMAEVAVSRDLFRRILALIDDLRPRRGARC